MLDSSLQAEHRSTPIGEIPGSSYAEFYHILQLSEQIELFMVLIFQDSGERREIALQSSFPSCSWCRELRFLRARATVWSSIER
jgi:hypothetical protein